MSLGKRFDELKVSDLDETTSKMPPMVQKSASIGQAIDLMIASSESERVYVIDIEGNLVGLVTTKAIMSMFGHRMNTKQNHSKTFIEIYQDVVKESVEQVIQMPVPVKPSTPLKTAISSMIDNELAELPVVDDDYKLIGELSGLELLAPAILLRDKEP